MRNVTRISLLSLVTALAVVTPSTAAWAAPSNDDIAGAVVIPSLPFSHQVNTAEATIGANDPSACVDPQATVWYTFTPDVTGRVQIDTFGSDYDTTLAAYSGSADPANQVACNDDTNGLSAAVRFTATAGTQYLIMAGTCCGGGPPVGPGGNLVLNASVAPPSPTLDLSVNPAGKVSNAGSATVAGTITCNFTGSAWVNVDLTQRLGRLVA